MNGAAESGRRASISERLKPAPVYTRPVTFHYEIQAHTSRMQKLTDAFRVYRLMAMTLVCVLAGIIIGLICRPFARTWNERHFMYIEFPGELYLRFLRLLIIPLLVSNVILSFGTIQGKISSKLGKVAGSLYLASNFIAITVAILCVITIRPGGAERHLESTRPPGASGLYNGGGATGYGHQDFGNTMRGHHYLHEYHDSIGRYREYHPMFYHTHRDEETPTNHIVLTNYNYSPLADRPTAIAATTTIIAPPKSEINEHQQNQEQVKEVEQQKLVGQFRLPEQGDESSIFGEKNRIGLSTKLPIDVLLDVMRNLIPDSIIGATLQQSRTRLFTPRELRIDKNGSTEPAPNRWPMGHEVVEQPNIIGLLAMSVLTGVFLSHMGEASKPLLDLCSCISELSLRFGMKAIHMAPLCIMFLLIGQVARARNLNSIAGELFMYSLTVVLALIIHGLIILPLAYYFVTKKSPLDFFKGMLEALVASFATSSSSSTMALMLNCLTELDINLVIVRAFGPLGSVFNMNGTSIFEAVAVIFIAQTLGLKLPLTSLLLVGLCSAVASLSTSGIPSSGMMTMVIVLNAINLPVLELSLIYIVDFIIDRFRTVLNVWSGAIVCGLINHICPEDLFDEPEKYREMVKYRQSRGSLSSRKQSTAVDEKPQIISITITPPPPTPSDETSKI